MTDTSGPQVEVETDFKVSFNENTIVCVRPDGVVDQVDWSELEAITLEATLAEHPEPQHIWIMWGLERKSGCVFPGRAEGSNEIVEEIKRRLPDFDHKAFVTALNSAEHKTYVVWTTEQGTEEEADAASGGGGGGRDGGGDSGGDSGGDQPNPFLSS